MNKQKATAEGEAQQQEFVEMTMNEARKLAGLEPIDMPTCDFKRLFKKADIKRIRSRT